MSVNHACQGLSLLDRRMIEAETLLKTHAVLGRRHGEKAALALLFEIVDADALKAGRHFAAQAPDGPSLPHFATILEKWKGGGALETANVTLTADAFSFEVIRCAYADGYRAMGVAEHLLPHLSCRRDAAFAKGYDARLVFERTATIAEGAPACLFRFTWRG